MKDNTAYIDFDDDTETKSKKEPNVYLNIVLDGKEVSLPYGMGLDTMPKLKLSGSAEWQKTVIARNKLLDKLLQLIASKCKPGETLEIPNLRVVARVKNDKVDDTSVDEDFDFGI